MPTTTQSWAPSSSTSRATATTSPQTPTGPSVYSCRPATFICHATRATSGERPLRRVPAIPHMSFLFLLGSSGSRRSCNFNMSRRLGGMTGMESRIEVQLRAHRMLSGCTWGYSVSGGRYPGSTVGSWPRHLEGLKFAKRKIHADVRRCVKAANVSHVLLR